MDAEGTREFRASGFGSKEDGNGKKYEFLGMGSSFEARKAMILIL